MNRKTRMKVVRSGETREINCHPAERDFMARLARQRRDYAARYKDPRPSLRSIRETAAGRYC